MRRLKPKTRLKPRVWREHDSVRCSRHSTSTPTLTRAIPGLVSGVSGSSAASTEILEILSPGL
jgi:hypothetical protein